MKEENLQLLKTVQDSWSTKTKRAALRMESQRIKQKYDAAAEILDSFVRANPKNKHYVEANYYLERRSSAEGIFQVYLGL